MDDDGHGDVLQRALFGAIEDGAVGEERQPTFDDFLEHGGKPIDVEIGLLLAGVARCRGISAQAEDRTATGPLTSAA